LSQLRQLLRGDMAGDPMARRGLWTGLHLEEISSHLQQLGLSVCPNTVRRLLGKLDVGLHANRKSLSGPQSPQRDTQFEYIRYQREQFLQEGLPVVSVDTKKKEQVGRFKNPGRIWSREPLRVNDHDFPSLGSGVAIPRGLYDVQANRGWVVVGTSHDTAQFAVDALVDWWRGSGRRVYPQAAELLILADTGGSNSARSRLWKHALQERLVDRFGLAVTVCHYPTGASKWNPIEHRLFSEISKHWGGQPLTDYPSMVRLIRDTKTRTGLHVHCAFDTTLYATKVKVSDEQMASLDLFRHTLQPEWNYTLFPRLNRN
jgi:hypothetical protein